MTKLSDIDLQSFQDAILKDYGVKLEGEELYEAAFNLLQFFEALVTYKEIDRKEKGSKIV